MKEKVLFICTQNSARSHRAEGYVNVKYADRHEAFSAGNEKTQVHLMAISVMQEIGIDIFSHRSKHLNEFFGKGIETVVTVCDLAQGACPSFPGAKKVIHHSFPDSSGFNGSDEEFRAGFHRVRDEINRSIDATFGSAHA